MKHGCPAAALEKCRKQGREAKYLKPATCVQEMHLDLVNNGGVGFAQERMIQTASDCLCISWLPRYGYVNMSRDLYQMALDVTISIRKSVYGLRACKCLLIVAASTSRSDNGLGVGPSFLQS